MSSHTRGPMQVIEHNRTAYGYRLCCEVKPKEGGPAIAKFEHKADAQLFAKAGEMLERLEWVRRHCELGILNLNDVAADKIDKLLQEVKGE